jgi:hypothetical protein
MQNKCTSLEYNLYALSNVIKLINLRRMRWAGHVAQTGEMRNEHKVFVGKPEGKRPHKRPRRRWEDNVKLNLMEMGGGEVWTGSIWHRMGTDIGVL